MLVFSGVSGGAVKIADPFIGVLARALYLSMTLVAGLGEGFEVGVGALKLWSGSVTAATR